MKGDKFREMAARCGDLPDSVMVAPGLDYVGPSKLRRSERLLRARLRRALQRGYRVVCLRGPKAARKAWNNLEAFTYCWSPRRVQPLCGGDIVWTSGYTKAHVSPHRKA